MNGWILNDYSPKLIIFSLQIYAYASAATVTCVWFIFMDKAAAPASEAAVNSPVAKIADGQYEKSWYPNIWTYGI